MYVYMTEMYRPYYYRPLYNILLCDSTSSILLCKEEGEKGTVFLQNCHAVTVSILILAMHQKRIYVYSNLINEVCTSAMHEQVISIYSKV